MSSRKSPPLSRPRVLSRSISPPYERPVTEPSDRLRALLEREFKRTPLTPRSMKIMEAHLRENPAITPRRLRKHTRRTRAAMLGDAVNAEGSPVMDNEAAQHNEIAMHFHNKARQSLNFDFAKEFVRTHPNERPTLVSWRRWVDGLRPQEISLFVRKMAGRPQRSEGLEDAIRMFEEAQHLRIDRTPARVKNTNVAGTGFLARSRVRKPKKTQRPYKM